MNTITSRLPEVYGCLSIKELDIWRESVLDEMSMEDIGDILNILPVVRLKEDGDTITVMGFFARDLAGDIHRAWGSARVSNNIFIELNARSFTIHKFFLIEVLYILDAIYGNPKTRTSKGTIRDIKNLLLTKSWYSETKENEPLPTNFDAIKTRMNVSLLPNQRDFITDYAVNAPKLDLKGNVLHSPPGTGKTIAAFAFSLAMESDVTVIMVPKNSLHEVWEDTIKTRFKKVPKYWISSSAEEPTGKEEFLICHYESLPRIVHLARKLANKKLTVWLDESHNFVESISARTKRFVQFCKDSEADHVIWASGTPFKAKPTEAIPILQVIDPLFTKDVELAFRAIFGVTTARGLDILNNRISKMTFKVEKSSIVQNVTQEYTNTVKFKGSDQYTLGAVQKEMRDFIIERVNFYKEHAHWYREKFLFYMDKFSSRIKSEETRKEFKLYLKYANKMNKSFSQQEDLDLIRYCKRFEREYIEPSLKGEHLKEFRHVAPRFKYLLLVIRGECLGRILTRRRIDAFMDMVEPAKMERYVDVSEAKTVIFTSYVDVAKTIVEDFRKKGYNPALVIGETNKDLMPILESAKTQKDINPIVATYQSLSTAVPLVFANTVIFHDLPFRDYILDQAKSRVDRLNQPNKVHFVYNILDTDGKPNLSTRNQDIMAWSKQQVDALLKVDSSVADEVEI